MLGQIRAAVDLECSGVKLRNVLETQKQTIKQGRLYSSKVTVRTDRRAWTSIPKPRHRGQRRLQGTHTDRKVLPQASRRRNLGAGMPSAFLSPRDPRTPSLGYTAPLLGFPALASRTPVGKAQLQRQTTPGRYFTSTIVAAAQPAPPERRNSTQNSPPLFYGSFRRLEPVGGSDATRARVLAARRKGTGRGRGLAAGAEPRRS